MQIVKDASHTDGFTNL